MPEKLLLTGRAGSGKTGAILDRLRRAILDGRSTEVLLILPTQSQVDHLRGVLLRDGVPAFRDDFAHTFFTLARSFARVLPEQLLSEEGKGYLLGEVLRLESLPSFQGVRDTRGFRRFLGEAIQELKQNGVQPESYARLILDPLGGVRGTKPRHRDLGKAFEAYQRRLSDYGRVDQEDLELRALTRLESEPELTAGRKLMLVDGFHDFTPVQFGILMLLAGRTAESVFTLSFDLDRPAHPPFQASQKTRERLLSLGFRETGLRDNRRTEDPTLRRLEAGLFEERRPAPMDAGSALRFVRAARREDEMESIARSIVRLVREEKVPYRDIAVLYHDLSEVTDLLEGTFRRFGIPLRIFQPRALQRHPLIGFLLDLGTILAEGPRRETMLRLLRSGYVEGLDLAEVDRLDQNLREEGAPPSGAAWTALCSGQSTPSLGKVLRSLETAAKSVRDKHTQDTLAAAWLRCFEVLVLPLGEQGPEGPSECAAYQEFLRLLETAKLLSHGGKIPIPMRLLVETVREGVAQATFHLQDRRREAVNAINAFEARQWEVPYLFVAGVLERQFPPAPLEGLFFDDEDRLKLNVQGLRFPERQWRQAEERFLFYTAVTRARSGLWLSCACADAQGNPALPSFFLREVEKLFTSESLQRATVAREASEILPPPREMVGLEDVDRTIYLGLEERAPQGMTPQGVALAAALYNRRRETPAFQARLAFSLSGQTPTLKDPAVRGDLARREMAFSNSGLVDFLQCPYKHFVTKWMRLHGLPEPRMSPLDLGQVLHATLKKCLESPGEGEPFDLLRREFERVARARAATFRSRSDSWRLRDALRAVLQAEKARRGALRPAGFEISFGTRGENSKPPVPLPVGDREEALSGRIDRIDADAAGKAGFIVDYKYSDPDTVRDQFKGTLSEEMTDFQLAIYLLALKEVLTMEPLGAELLSMKKQVRRFSLGRTAAAELWRPPERSRIMSDSEFDGYLQHAKEAMAALIASARSGDIETRPRALEGCGPGVCDGADICRFDRWIGGAAKGD